MTIEKSVSYLTRRKWKVREPFTEKSKTVHEYVRGRKGNLNHCIQAVCVAKGKMMLHCCLPAVKASNGSI